MEPARPPEQEDARVPLKKQGVSSFVKHSCKPLEFYFRRLAYLLVLILILNLTGYPIIQILVLSSAHMLRSNLYDANMLVA